MWSAGSQDVMMNELPDSVSTLRRRMEMEHKRPRPRCAAFSHSLQRNGANNFLLYVIRKVSCLSQEYAPIYPCLRSLSVIKNLSSFRRQRVQ